MSRPTFSVSDSAHAVLNEVIERADFFLRWLFIHRGANRSFYGVAAVLAGLLLVIPAYRLSCFDIDITARMAENLNAFSRLPRRAHQTPLPKTKRQKLRQTLRLRCTTFRLARLRSRSSGQTPSRIGFFVSRTRFKDQSNECSSSFFCATGW